MSSELQAGSSFGHFIIDGLLGSGGMATVYAARNTKMGDRVVALKVLSEEARLDDPDSQTRFQHEFGLASKVRHDNLVTIYSAGCGFDDDESSPPWIEMERIPGEDLAKQLSASPPPVIERALRLVEQVGAGLHALHRSGLVHRDVKPSNILVEDPASSETEAKALLADFGLVKAVDGTTTRTGARAPGTPGYQAPEMLSGTRATPKSDQFSLACVLYELLAGKRAFPDGASAGTSPGAIAGVPPHVATALALALSMSPDHRFRDVREFLQALRGDDTGAASIRPTLDGVVYPLTTVGSGDDATAKRVWMQRWETFQPDLELLIRHARSESVGFDDFTELGVFANRTDEDGVAQIAMAVRGVLGSVIERVLGDRGSEGAAKDPSYHAVVGWKVWLEAHEDPLQALETEHPHVHDSLANSNAAGSIEEALRRRMWRGAEPTHLQGGVMRGLRAFVGAIDEAHRHERRRVPTVSQAAATAALTSLLPETMLQRLGLTEVTQVQRSAYPRLTQVVEERESMLVLGPPGCGKSWVGQVVAAHTVHAARLHNREQRALILVPTKAMVRENLTRWRAWTASEDPAWRVVAGSADDREYDETLAEGDFDVGIAVYEKLAALVCSQPQVLARVGVIVVDEIQNVGHRQKGLALEALLTVIRLRWPGIPIVGLSATMSRTSVRAVCDWLGFEHLVETQARSTDLRVHLFDGASRRAALFPGATDEQPDTTASQPIDKGISRYPLRRPQSWAHGRLAERADRLHVKTPILQIVTLLENASESDRRILCFVRDRDRAAEVADLIRNALHIAHGAAGGWNNPWLDGRYARGISPGDAEAALRQLLDIDAHTWRSEAHEGLRAGVGYHTAALQSDLRQILEEEFKGGLLRVLVCTDTLAEGVNLPASDVVLADLTWFDPETRSLTPVGPGQFKNRIGRAGRLGTRASGEREQGNAWVFIDPASDADDDIVKRLDDAWDHWVLGKVDDERSESALSDPIEGHLNLCGLVLRALAVHKHRLTRNEMLERIETVMAATYWAACGGHANAGEILTQLEDDGFMQTLATSRRAEQVHETLVSNGCVATGDEDRWHVTRLGIAIARSSLSLDSSPTIKRIAAIAPTVGAFSLLVEAAKDGSVTRNLGSKWLSWKANQPLAARSRVMADVHEYARLYAHPDRELRQTYARDWMTDLTRPDERPRVVVPDQKLIDEGAGSLSDELYNWVIGEPPAESAAEAASPEHQYATAVLRATIAYERAAFEPWEEMHVRLKRIGRDVEVPIAGSPADVAQLAERIAHLLGSAAEIVAESPETRYRLRALANRVKSGVPRWLLPLWTLHERGLSREAILRFDRAGPRTDNLEHVLATYDAAISEEVRAAALEKLRAQRESHELLYRRVPRKLDGRSTPSKQTPGYTLMFEAFMAHDDPAQLLTAIRRLLYEHAVGELTLGLQERAVVAGGALDGLHVDLLFLLDELTDDRLGALANTETRTVVVPMRCPVWNVETKLDELDGSPLSAITPRALWVVVAELGARFLSGDRTGRLLETLTAAGGFSRHGDELVAHSAPPRPAVGGEDVDDRRQALFGNG